MKEQVFTRIINFKNEWFLDYSFNKKDWKNHSVRPTKEKAIKDMNKLSDVYCVTNITSYQ